MKNREEIYEYFEKDKQEMLVWQILGPLSLLCAFVLAARFPLPYDLYGVSLMGLFLSARYHFRGCFYALVVLILTGIFQHGLGNVDHLWRLGLEGAIACSFFITALAFENTSLKLDLLFSQVKAKQAALEHSEEDLAKTREEAAQKQMLAAEKLDILQKDLEETMADKGAFEVLNDVLRKVAAVHQDEKNLLEDHLIQDKRRLAQSHAEIEELQREISEFKSSSQEQERTELLEELNEARLAKEQTHLINEQLARLHAKESMRAQIAIEQLQLTIDSKRNLQEQLREAVTQAEASMLALQQAEKEREQYQGALDQMERLQEERIFLQERLKAADVELSLVKKNPVESEALRQERDQLTLQLNKAQERIHFLAKLEPLYRQLRAQFEEKNKILQETRSALFHVDTELETLKIERDQQANLLPEALSSEFVQLDEQVALLEKENEQLQGLVTHFMSQLPQGPKKQSLSKTLDDALIAAKQRRRGKVKEQDLLF